MRHLAYALLGIILSATTTILGATTVPFQLVGKLIIIQAKINGQPGNFVVDTGVEHLVLNSNYYRGRSLPQQLFHGVTGQPVRMEMGIFDLEIGNRYFDDQYTEIVYLNGLERVKQIRIHGLIGMRVLQQYTLMFDFQRQQLSLLDRLPPLVTTHPPFDTLHFRWKRFLLCLQAHVGDQELTLALDTGAEIGWLAPPYRKRLRPYLQPITGTTSVGSFNAYHTKEKVSRLRLLRFGRDYSPPIRFAFGWLHAHNSLPGPRLHGLIGYGSLDADQLAFDFERQLVYRWRSDRPPSDILVERQYPQKALIPTKQRE